MTQLMLLIAFLPEPLYTVFMAMLAVSMIVVFGLATYKVCLKVLNSGWDYDEPTPFQSKPDHDTAHLNHVYFLRDRQTSMEVEVLASPAGHIMSISSGDKQIQTGGKMLLVQTSDLGYNITDDNGRVVREMEMTDQHIVNQ